MTTNARVDGAPASLDAAIAAAAALLGTAHQPLIAALEADTAGIGAAIRLARRLGGVVDHVRSASVLRDLEVMRRSGWIVTTPLEARARADVLVLVGPGLGDEQEELALVLAGPPRYLDGATRTVLRLSPDGTALLSQLARLRMSLAGRKVEIAPSLSEIAAALRAARYAVIAWSAAHLGADAVEMLCGLVETLNAQSRCAGLPLAAGGNAMGAAQVAAWLTGFPLPVGFGRGFPEHDPWRFGATRLAESGESDAALWLAALEPAPPPWTRTLDLIALVPQAALGAPWVGKAKVAIPVARPGAEHDAVFYEPRLAALAARRAHTPAQAPAASDVIAAIEAALPPC